MFPLIKLRECSYQGLRIPPSLTHCHRVLVGMSKAPFSSGQFSTRTDTNLTLSPKWRRLISLSCLRKKTVLRYLISRWHRIALDWQEQELLLVILGDFSRTMYEAKFLLKYLENKPMKDQNLSEWVSVLVQEDCVSKITWLMGDDLSMRLYHTIKFLNELLFSQRALKGLVTNPFFLARLGRLLVPFHPVSEGKSNVKRRRKRGHNDHGALPADKIRREADEAGGRKLHHRRLLSPLYWLDKVKPP